MFKEEGCGERELLWKHVFNYTVEFLPRVCPCTAEHQGKDAALGWGCWAYGSGGGDKVVSGTCQARKARKELPVVFVQEVKCEMQPSLNKCSQSWNSNTDFSKNAFQKLPTTTWTSGSQSQPHTGTTWEVLKQTNKQKNTKLMSHGRAPWCNWCGAWPELPPDSCIQPCENSRPRLMKVIVSEAGTLGGK